MPDDRSSTRSQRVTWILHVCLTFGLVSMGDRLPAFDARVPQEVEAEVSSEEVVLPDGTTCAYFLRPPVLGEAAGAPVLLGCAGGNGNRALALYCYAAYFRSAHVDAYTVVVPVREGASRPDAWTSAQRSAFMAAVQEAHESAPHGWLGVGTSNGGAEIFEHVLAAPERFAGVIAAPGLVRLPQPPPPAWRDCRFVFAVGSEDDAQWRQVSRLMQQHFSEAGLTARYLELPGIGHIFPIGNTQDALYLALADDDEPQREHEREPTD